MASTAITHAGAALPVRLARFRRGGRSSLTTVGPVSNILIRWGGSRAVASLILRILVVILLVVGVPLFAYWPFGKVHAPAVEVHDEVGILQADATASSLENLRFRQDVKLAVLTLDAKPNANFNSEVLGYAREKHPEWIISSDSNYWADGLVILAVSPSGRWTGCYFGEDVKVDTAVQGAIQEAGKNSFREQRWALGIEQMAGYAAEVMGRPIVSPSGAIIVAGLGVISGGALGILMLVSRSGARLAFTRARRHYAQVTADYEGTQIKAELIPTDDAHGAQVLARFAWFEDRYAELTRAFRDFGELRGAEWFSWRRRMDARGLNTRASELDSLDDAISHASALLTMSEGWQQAWANEQGPVHEDLASFQSLCASVEAKGHLSTAQDRDWLRQRSNRLAAMTNELSSGRLSPSAALDELDVISRDVRARADSLARRALEADTSSYRDGRLSRYESAQSGWGWGRTNGYAGWWAMGGHQSSYDPASTIRINPSSPAADASGVRWVGAGSASQFSTPISELVTGYSSAASWSPSSSGSGGGSGFSGGGYSGGGFSGAGSSSHF